ncbi:MAG TPA: efflux RND transporter periplasmic adaptor subunit [Stellaceae bacterium]|nr:efflux RND transporter periplasmic adaptor subunit [Stellaceae bacterium]
MNRPSILPAICVALASVFLLADADDNVSAQVTLTQLQKGGLDHIIIAYGKVEASDAASQSVAAPLSGIVGDVYVRVGQQVAKDAPLLLLRPSPKTSSDYTQAKSAFSAASAEAERTRKLLGEHLATTQQLADAQKALSDARSTLAAMEAQGAGGPQTVRAPSPAIVTAIAVKPGANVSVGGNLVELAQQGRLVLGVGVTPAQAELIEPGDDATITRIGETAKTPGKVESRGSVVDADDGLVNVSIALPPGKFFLGEMAQAGIATAKVTGYVVPHQAILVDDSGKTYVVQSNDLVAKKVIVKVLEAGGAKDVIEGPLDPKAPLVLEGNYQLDDGMKMRVAAAAGKNGADKAADPQSSDPKSGK